MLKFTLLTEQDRKEAAKIERRRKVEEERKQRIFNARNRVIGIDSDTLNKQIIEKNTIKEQENKLNDLYLEQQRHHATVALMLQKKEFEERRKIYHDINEYRKVFQKPETRREFDLNDPNRLKNSVPCRTTDDDPRCGISSAQRFEGEDLSSEARWKLQTKQSRAWLEQQIHENNEAKKYLKLAEEECQIAMVERDRRAIELENLEKQCKKKLVESMANFNLALSVDNNYKKSVKNKEETEDNYAEIYNAVTGDFLTENPDVALSNFGPNRCLGFMYKGMSPQEKEAVRKKQLEQIEENRRKKEQEKLMEQKWNSYADDMIRQADQKYKEILEKQRVLHQRTAEENAHLSDEQKARKEYLDNIVYTNRPSAAYFDQFNTSSR